MAVFAVHPSVEGDFMKERPCRTIGIGVRGFREDLEEAVRDGEREGADVECVGEDSCAEECVAL